MSRSYLTEVEAALLRANTKRIVASWQGLRVVEEADDASEEGSE